MVSLRATVSDLLSIGFSHLTHSSHWCISECFVAQDKEPVRKMKTIELKLFNFWADMFCFKTVFIYFLICVHLDSAVTCLENSRILLRYEWSIFCKVFRYRYFEPKCVWNNVWCRFWLLDGDVYPTLRMCESGIQYSRACCWNRNR